MVDRIKPQSIEPIPDIYARGQWEPVGFTSEEGAKWTPISNGTAPVNYSAIQYRNGWVFDNVLAQLNVNPWRHADDTSERLTPDE